MTSRTISKQLREDPRLGKMKQELISLVEEYQEKITGIRPPKDNLQIEYDQVIEEFTQVRGGKLFYPYLGSGFGKGPLVELMDGSVKYDFIIGIGAHFFGHNHPEIMGAGIDAALSDTVMQGHLQQNRDAVSLSHLLVDASGLDHCFISSTGVMANENGLKIIFQKNYPRNRILAFEGCFMGRTLALSQVTDKPVFREGLPLNVDVDYIPFYDDQDPEGSTERAVNALRKHLARYPGKHAVMCFELVQGEAGFRPGTTRFFSALMEILKEEGIAVLVDEVQTFGRTPELFAFHHFQLQKYVDVVTIGKLSQICATLYRSEFVPRPGLLSQTFTASTSAIRAATVLIQKLIDEGYYGHEGKIVKLHHHFAEGLKNLETAYPDKISGPFGIGAMIAFTPYGGEREKVLLFVRKLFDKGVISFIAGSKLTRCRFLVPAVTLTEKDIDEVLSIIEGIVKI